LNEFIYERINSHLLIVISFQFAYEIT
jgi:hypothetical protein